jgi:hypothetical protein
MKNPITFLAQLRTTLTAILAICCTSAALSQVYSVNTVGYVVRELQEGFNLMNNPMDYQGNMAKEIYPDMPDGTQLVIYSAATGYSIITFDGGEWLPNGDAQLPPGRGHWVRVPRRIFHTYVGVVRQGDLSTPLVKGLNLVGSQVPQEGLLSADLWYLPSEGDQCLQYRPDRGYTTFTYDGGEWLGAQPYLAVAEGIWVRRGEAGFWQRSFSVNP